MDSRSAPPRAAAEAPQRLLTFKSGGWVLLIAIALTALSAYIVLLPVFQTGFQQAVGDGVHPETYGFDLSNLTIPRGELIASGRPKDGVNAVPAAVAETMTRRELALMIQNEHIRYFTPSDQVIGVTFGGESRAYSVRMLNLHEVVNDTVGGKPILVTWAPLTGSAAVFERPEKTDFGVSGLLYESNLIMFDRQSDAKKESLWLQLGMRAISGPAAGKKLTLLPFELTTWKAWTEAHPNTLVFRGLRTLKEQYNMAQDPFNLYLSTDDLLFPVSPLPPFKNLLKKTPLTLTTTDLKHWKARLWEPNGAGATTQHTGGELRMYSFLFAWYAQHSQDTDYSAIPH